MDTWARTHIRLASQLPSGARHRTRTRKLSACPLQTATQRSNNPSVTDGAAVYGRRKVLTRPPLDTRRGLVARRRVGIRRRRRGCASDGASAPAHGRADRGARGADRKSHDAAYGGAQGCAGRAAPQGVCAGLVGVVPIPVVGPTAVGRPGAIGLASVVRPTAVVGLASIVGLPAVLGLAAIIGLPAVVGLAPIVGPTAVIGLAAAVVGP